MCKTRVSWEVRQRQAERLSERARQKGVDRDGQWLQVECRTLSDWEENEEWQPPQHSLLSTLAKTGAPVHHCLRPATAPRPLLNTHSCSVVRAVGGRLGETLLLYFRGLAYGDAGGNQIWHWSSASTTLPARGWLVEPRTSSLSL